MRLRPLHGTFGAEVIGVPNDLRMDDTTFHAVEQAWFDHSILLFRGLRMTPEDHISFTIRLGPLHIMEPLNMNLPGRPEVFVVSNAIKDAKPIGLKRAGEGYHTDGEDKRPECRFVPLRDRSATGRRRYDFRRHVCRA